MDLLIAFEVRAPDRAAIAEVVGHTADVIYLSDFEDEARHAVLRNAVAVISWYPDKELRPGEGPLLANARFIQFMTAGVDFISFKELPSNVPMATNGGAYAEPMAEHAIAMALAAAKRLLVEHQNLRVGQFNQFRRNRMLRGHVCGIFGLGGIGEATARLGRGLGMRVYGINRRGVSDEPMDWIGTPDRLHEMLAASDVLVISAPLTKATIGLIGAGELALMKKDAILVNVARGEIIQEQALYDHLARSPEFTACIDAWWVEPVRHGQFRLDLPFLELPNVIGSPHNSAQVRGTYDAALRAAVANCRRALLGEAPLHLIGPDEKLK